MPNWLCDMSIIKHQSILPRFLLSMALLVSISARADSYSYAGSVGEVIFSFAIIAVLFVATLVITPLIFPSGYRIIGFIGAFVFLPVIGMAYQLSTIKHACILFGAWIVAAFVFRKLIIIDELKNPSATAIDSDRDVLK